MTEEDSLENLKKRLYQSNDKSLERRFERPELKEGENEVAPEWKKDSDDQSSEESESEIREKIFSFLDMKKIIWGIIIFALVASTVAAFYLFGGLGAISSRNIKIEILAPEEVSGGDLVRWEVAVTNLNNVSLEAADITFLYPRGSRPASDSVGKFLSERRKIGKIDKNETKRETFSAFVFGGEGDEKKVSAVLEYRTTNSNAIFEAAKEVGFIVSRSPVGVSINIPKEVNIGREFDIEIEYVSNSSDTIKDLIVDVDFPEGIKIVDASFSPFDGESKWRVGDLSAGEKRSLKLSGIFEDEGSDTGSITASVGVLNRDGFDVYGQTTVATALKKLFLGLDIEAVGSENSVVYGGESVDIRIMWRNNLPSAVDNATLEVEIDGNIADPRFINVSDGFYRASDKKVIWTPSSLKRLQRIEPGEAGETSFSFRVVENSDAASLGSGQTAKLKGLIVPALTAPEFRGVDVSGSDEIDLKLGTDIQLASRAFYNSSVLRGSGPIPPKVGSETVYTIVWSLINSANNTGDVVVRGALPAYIDWKGVFSPQAEDIRFDPATSEVIWRVSRLNPGTGFISPAREVLFQIGITPSVDQVGRSPVLIFDIGAQGRDLFTKEPVASASPNLTTDIARFDQRAPVEGRVTQ